MIVTIPDMPEGTIGLAVAGSLTEADYHHLLATVAAAAAEGGGLRLLYQVGDEVIEQSAGAFLQDAVLGLRHLWAWDRTALVTSSDGWVRLPAGFGWAYPEETQVFRVAQLQEAKDWLVLPAAAARRHQMNDDAHDDGPAGLLSVGELLECRRQARLALQQVGMEFLRTTDQLLPMRILLRNGGAVVAYDADWFVGSPLETSEPDDALRFVADAVQEALIERYQAVWPVCPAHWVVPQRPRLMINCELGSP